MARFRVFYPTRHRWDAGRFASKERAILHADKRAACFAVLRAGAVLADAEHLRCPRLDGECAASCRCKKPFRGGFAQDRRGAEVGQA